MKRALRRFADGILTVTVEAAVGYAVGALFVWLWAPTPTPENASPPPEAFLFLIGALVGFFAAVLARVLFVPFWLGRRRHVE